jgi:hypothetical protein
MWQQSTIMTGMFLPVIYAGNEDDSEISIKKERETAYPGREVNMEDVMDGIRKKARDHPRSPMQACYYICKPF